ncbi:MAG TPA: flagellar hook-length control protein FliK [Cellvibrionaceae bacterium]
MPIDFTRLYGATSPAARGASPVNADLQAALGLSRGQVVTASVSKVASADALQGQWQRRDIELPLAKLPQTLDSPSPSPARSNSAPDPALQSLLSRQALYMVALAIKGHTLITVTDQLLQKGQKVEVLLNSDNRLQLQPPKPPGLEAPPVTANAAPRPASPLVAANSSKPPPLDQISQVLRQLLPEQGRPALLSTVNVWQQGLQHLPNTPQASTLQNLLAELAARPIKLDRAGGAAATVDLPVPPATTIKAAIEHSGALLEPRLAAAIARQAPSTEVSQILNTDTKALLLKIATLSAPDRLAGLVGLTRSEVNALLPSPAAPAAAPPPSTAGTPAQPVQPPAGSYDGAKPLLATQQGLPGLLMLLASTPPASSEMRTLQIQLVTLLHQQTLANLARVRLGQLSPDNPRVRGGELPASTPTALAMDVPVRHDGEIHLIKMTIHEEQENPESGREKNTPSEKIWQVKLHLDTQSIGEFHAHLKFVRNVLSLDFWSADASVLSEARAKFSAIKKALSSAGIDVSQVKYHRGEPVQSGNRLAYALVDINT